jgi:hypothetical protein
MEDYYLLQEDQEDQEDRPKLCHILTVKIDLKTFTRKNIKHEIQARRTTFSG